MNKATKAESIYLGEGEYIVSVLISTDAPEIWRIVSTTLSSKQAEKIISEINSGLGVSDKEWLKCANAELHAHGFYIV